MSAKSGMIVSPSFLILVICSLLFLFIVSIAIGVFIFLIFLKNVLVSLKFSILFLASNLLISAHLDFCSSCFGFILLFFSS